MSQHIPDEDYQKYREYMNVTMVELRDLERAIINAEHFGRDASALKARREKIADEREACICRMTQRLHGTATWRA